VRLRPSLSLLAAGILAVVGATLVPAATASASPPDNELQIVFAVDEGGFPYGSYDEDTNTFTLDPGADILSLFAFNNDSENDFALDTASRAKCGGAPIVPRADQPTSPNYVACPLAFDAKPETSGTLGLTLNGTWVGSEQPGGAAFSANYTVLDDRPIVTAAANNAVVADGGSVTAPLGSAIAVDADAVDQPDGAGITGAHFVSPSPAQCLAGAPTDIDSSVHVFCATSLIATGTAQTATFAVSGTSQYREDAEGQTSFSYRGNGGCTVQPTVDVGDKQTVTCTGFEPGIGVTAVQHSTPTTVATLTVPSTGAFTFSYTVPAGAGKHVVTILLDGTVLYTTASFTVPAAGLALTGTNVGWQPFGTAGLALLAGFGLWLVGRRRSTQKR
jgi:hypothetical protein